MPTPPGRLGAGLGLLLLCLAGCGSPTATDALRFGLSAAPVSLDPRQATDAESSRVNRLLYRQLVDFDPMLRPVPALADWQRLEPTRYRFHLRAEGRQFHHGPRLDAADVKATYDFILDPANASPHRGTLSVIRQIRVIDADRVEFELNHPDPLFPGYLSVGIVPACVSAAVTDPACAGVAGRPLNTQPLGSGPFEFVAWPEEGRLQLRRRDDGLRLEFVSVSEPLVRVLKLLRGELHLLQNGLPPELLTWLARHPDLQVSRARGSHFSYLGFNLQDPHTGQLAVRQAVAHAIDRDALIASLLGGAARPAEALLPPDHWAGAPGLPGHAHDPAKARALLGSLGYSPRRPLRLSYKTSSNPFRLRLATAFKYQLDQVGFKVDLRSYDWGTFYSDIKSGRFQMFSLSWVGIKAPDIFRYAFHSASVPPAGANRGRFNDPATDRLIDAALAAPEAEEQARLYREVQARLLQQLPYVPLWYEDHVLVARPGVSGYQLAPDGNYDGLRQVRITPR